MTPREAATRRVASDRKSKAEREDLRRAYWSKWITAHRVRGSWGESDFDNEEERLRAEIAARLAAGAVTVCPPVWTKGSTGQPELAP
jgi:hypothetical protein